MDSPKVSTDLHIKNMVLPLRISKTRTYKSWSSMKERCFNKNHKNYRYYGGRGITVCDRWKTFSNFYEDMGERPEETSIDRIDPNLGYFKENCQWATRSQQNKNKRRKRNSLLDSLRKNKEFMKAREFLGFPIEKAFITEKEWETFNRDA